MNIKNNIVEFVNKFFPFFLLGQVVIDLITTLFVKVVEIPISFGMIIRFAFIILASFYIMLKDNKKIKILLLLLLFMNIFQFVYLFLKVPDFNLFVNIRYYLRTVYYSVMILFLLSYSSELESNRILKIISFNIFSIVVIYLISNFTNTNLLMYGDNMVGSSGWFLSGNEIASIMSMLSPVALYIFYKKNSLFNFINLLGTAYVLVTMGTKTTLFVLFTLLVLGLTVLIYVSIKTRKNVRYLLIYLLMVSIVILNYSKLPAIKNIKYVSDLQKEIAYKNSFSDKSEIPENIKNSRYNISLYNDIDDFLSTINLSIKKNDNQLYIDVDGYLYPKYFDLSHPKYVEKYMILYNEKEEFVFELEDTYNRYIDQFLEEDYNADFSGVKGNFNISDLSSDVEYNIKFIVKIDGLVKEYIPNSNLNLICDRDIAVYDNNKLIIDKSKAFDKLYAETDIGKNINIPLLSGRAERVFKFVSKRDYYGIFNLFFGSGYINNYISDNGFEMDIIEIFITFGIIGFIIYFYGTMLLLYNVLKEIIKKPKLLFSNGNFLLLLSILYGFIMSLIVGHTILTPSPAIYLSILLIVYSKIMEESNEKFN